MWPEYLHHLTLHFAIVLPMILAAGGLYARRTSGAELFPILRWMGHFTLAITAIAVATGLVAGGFSGGEDSLQHHRYLGILAFIAVAIAALSYDHGTRQDIADLRGYGVAIWWVAAFAVIGASHWGTIAEHSDIIPF